MRGQRLFLRPVDSADAEAIGTFFAANGSSRPAPTLGILGKLVGDIVAVMSLEIDRDALRIDDLVVARELRRKHIGRYVVDEAARLAAKLERPALVVSDGRGADEFLRRTGFTFEDGMYVRRVG